MKNGDGVLGRTAGGFSGHVFGRHHGIRLEGYHSNDSLGGVGIVARGGFVGCVFDELGAGMG